MVWPLTGPFKTFTNKKGQVGERQEELKLWMYCGYIQTWVSLVAQMVKNLPAMWETWVWSLVWEDALEEGMATHLSILAWRTPWIEEPGGLQSMWSHRVRHNWVTKHTFKCTLKSYLKEPYLETDLLFENVLTLIIRRMLAHVWCLKIFWIYWSFFFFFLRLGDSKKLK